MFIVIRISVLTVTQISVVAPVSGMYPSIPVVEYAVSLLVETICHVRRAAVRSGVAGGRVPTPVKCVRETAQVNNY